MSKTTSQLNLRVTINTADREILEGFSGALGGNVRPTKCYGAVRKRQIYRWELTGIAAQTALKKLLPFLQSKRCVAVLALGMQFGSQKGSRKLPPEEVSNRLKIKEAISAINQRITEPNYIQNTKEY